MDVTVSQAAWTQQTNPGQPGIRQTMVSFYDREVQSEFKTNEEGRPIFEMKCYIKKIPPGDKLVEIDRKASKQDFMRYPHEYEMYMKHQTTPVNGTPLEAWAQITRAQVAEYKALNIFTVEQLAELPDGYGHKIMGFQNWKQKAQAFLMAAKGQGEFDKMQTELKKRDDEIARMKANETATADMMRAMKERLDALEGTAKPQVEQTRKATVQR